MRQGRSWPHHQRTRPPFLLSSAESCACVLVVVVATATKECASFAAEATALSPTTTAALEASSASADDAARLARIARGMPPLPIGGSGEGGWSAKSWRTPVYVMSSCPQRLPNEFSQEAGGGRGGGVQQRARFVWQDDGRCGAV
jgi:hypothetical protein